MSPRTIRARRAVLLSEARTDGVQMEPRENGRWMVAGTAVNRTARVRVCAQRPNRQSSDVRCSKRVEAVRGACGVSWDGQALGTIEVRALRA